MTAQEMGGLVRTLLAWLGGVLVSKGLIDNGTAETCIGAITALAIAFWSLRAKKAAAAAVAQACLLRGRQAQTGAPEPREPLNPL